MVIAVLGIQKSLLIAIRRDLGREALRGMESCMNAYNGVRGGPDRHGGAPVPARGAPLGSAGKDNSAAGKA